MRKLAAVVFACVRQGTVTADQRTVINSAVVDQVSGLVLVTVSSARIRRSRSMACWCASSTPRHRWWSSSSRQVFVTSPARIY
jgi:ABC-type uncharacterized transport system permease subunit